MTKIANVSLVCLWLMIPAWLPAEVRSLTILHTNDLHARLSPLINNHGGFAYFAAVVERERAGCTDCILLNGGDLAQGSPVSTIYQGMPVFEIANLFGFDAATLGNHDFDYGWQQAKKFVEKANYPIVSSNVVSGSGELITPKPYVILRVNGLRVAVIGAMTDSLKSLSMPKLLEDYHTIPVFETVRKYAAEVRPQADLIVLLGHLTGPEEMQFLKQAPEIPVIVSGHIHVGLKSMIEQDGRLLVRVKSYGEELGRLELQVDTEKKAPISWNWKDLPIDSTKIEPDPAVAKLVKQWEDKVEEKVAIPVGISHRHFDRTGVQHLAEQAIRDETGADFAFVNKGGVRDDIPEGKLQERNLWNVMPFDDGVVVGTFTGSQLPAVVLGDRKVDPDREYTLAVTDFVAENQESNENLRVSGLKFPKEEGLLRDILIRWVRKKKELN